MAFCFEDTSTKDIFARLYPESAENAFSFDELIARVSELTPLPEPERSVQFRGLLSPSQKMDERVLLATVDRLREALVLTHQDVEFAFSLLPVTPKNEELKALSHAYLDSPLSHDRTRAIWSVVEKFKASGQSSVPDVTFVIGRMGSALFKETARSFLALGSQGSLIETWQLSQPAGKKPLTVSGSAHSTLDRLAMRASKVVSRQSEFPTIIFFEGSEEERTFLELRLASLGVTFGALGFPTLLPAPFSKRTLAEFEVTDRNASVLIAPFTPLPAPCETFGYVGEGALRSRKAEIALSEEEVSLLRGQGIAVMRPSDQTERLKEMWGLATSLPMRLFTSLSEAHLPTSHVLLRPRKRGKVAKNENYHVELPLRSFSATQLEGFSRCPAQYLFQNRLKLRRVPLLSEESFALLFGQTVHLVLETLRKDNQPLTAEAMKVVFVDAVTALAPELKTSSPLYTLLEQRFESILSSIETLEKQLTSVLGTEKTDSVEEPFKIKFGDFELTGKIDRIEQRRDGSFLVLDYKTGTVEFSPGHIAEGLHFQALLYLLACEQLSKMPSAGFLFYDLKKGELKRGILVEESVSSEAKKAVTRGHTLAVEKLQALKEAGIAQMETIMRKIRSGDFTPTPSAQICGYCDYPALCRKGYGLV